MIETEPTALAAGLAGKKRYPRLAPSAQKSSLNGIAFNDVIDRMVQNGYTDAMTTIGRPREFDRDQALDKAMDLFWTQGYEATGMKDLLQHMGIGRQSLYDTFGDKRSLFLEAVEHYNRYVTQIIVDQLEAEGSPLENIRKMLNGCAKQVSDGNCRGCLLTNTLVELAPHDNEVADASRRVLSRIETAFRRALERASADGELPASADIRALARFFTSTMQGIVVFGKASVSRAAVKDVVKTALSVLDR